MAPWKSVLLADDIVLKYVHNEGKLNERRGAGSIPERFKLRALPKIALVYFSGRAEKSYARRSR